MDGTPLKKMSASLDPEGRVDYSIFIKDGLLPLHDRIGSSFTLRFTGIRTCMSCGKRVKKFYGQGTCFPCLKSAPEASPCIIRPELCEAHLGLGRDVEWEKEHHLQEHIVYLSFTGGVKVGVTRSTQVPVRWIDQGAVLAVPIARVPYRQLAGAIEVDLKRLFVDRTQWKAMITANGAGGEQLLEEARNTAMAQTAEALREYLLPKEPVVRLSYPLTDLPPKLVNVQLDKLPELEGRLHGIKGQYLVWADGRVLNVRNHTGYHVEVGF
ncbi:MAG: DUF2797 domain-containing protein [Flavobacteriales bacterium]|jgi:hypothetical protein